MPDFPSDAFKSCPSALAKIGEGLWDARYHAARAFCEAETRSYLTKDDKKVTFTVKDLRPGGKCSFWLPDPFRSWALKGAQAIGDMLAVCTLLLRSHGHTELDEKTCLDTDIVQLVRAQQAAQSTGGAQSKGAKRKRGQGSDSHVAADSQQQQLGPAAEGDPVLAALETARNGYLQLQQELTDLKQQQQAASSLSELGGASQGSAVVALLKEQLADAHAEVRRLTAESVELRMERDAARAAAAADAQPQRSSSPGS
jgi:hypothetical protein